MSAAPEPIDVAMKKKPPKQALKNTVTKTARKQLVGGRRRRKKTKNELRRRREFDLYKSIHQIWNFFSSLIITAKVP